MGGQKSWVAITTSRKGESVVLFGSWKAGYECAILRFPFLVTFFTFQAVFIKVIIG